MNTARPESVPYQLFMLALCVYTLLALAAEVVLRPGGEIRLLLGYADTAICAVFLLDFLLCIYRAPSRWRYLYTWGWLDLASSIPTIDVARWGRAARAARIFRVLRGVRATKILGSLALAKRAEKRISSRCSRRHPVAGRGQHLHPSGRDGGGVEHQDRGRCPLVGAQHNHHCGLWRPLSSDTGRTLHCRRLDVRWCGAVWNVLRLPGRVVRCTGGKPGEGRTRSAEGRSAPASSHAGEGCRTEHLN